MRVGYYERAPRRVQTDPDPIGGADGRVTGPVEGVGMTVPRIQSFEWNERASTPRFVREAIVETLGTGLRWGRIVAAAGPVFAEFCQRSGADRVLDLCSGSGEPVAILLEALAEQGLPRPRFTLSDLLPNEPAMQRAAELHPGAIDFVPEPVDATGVPDELDQPARTILEAFHHFPPELAGRILADCVRQRRAVFVLEGFPRSLPRLLAIVPAMTVAMAATPFRTRRDRLAKLLGTFVVPVIPAIGLWDAVVSVLRIHTEEELRAMVEPLGGGYTWEYRRIPYAPGGLATAFFGIPPRT